MCIGEEERRAVDLKKILKDNFEIVLAVAIGLAIITMYNLFFKEGGLFTEFTEEIISFCMDLIKGSIGMVTE